ncbi:MAG: LysR family transcriptional regulator [Xanthomonadales bacterium]|nr:LysR family transcriptional regulator [Xanthomonadales bacterium]
MRTFISVAETGSFSETARLLDVSAPLVSRHVSDLEAHLGIRLFNRSTRRVELSEAGAAYYPDCVALIEQLDAAESRIAGLGERPTGLLRVSVPMDFGRLFLGPAFRQFLSEAPEVRLDVRYEDREARFVEEQVDVALRIGQLPDSSLVARRLGSACLGCYASPDYLAAHGIPNDLEALRDHDLLAYSLSSTPGHWQFEGDEGRTAIPLAGRWRLSCNNGRALAEAACRSLGIVRLPEFLVQDHLEAGRLEEVLRHHRSAPLEISAVTLHRRFRPGKISAFLDFMEAHFRGRNDWLPGPDRA